MIFQTSKSDSLQLKRLRDGAVARESRTEKQTHFFPVASKGITTVSPSQSDLGISLR
jgi:hypothetical protein